MGLKYSKRRSGEWGILDRDCDALMIKNAIEEGMLNINEECAEFDGTALHAAVRHSNLEAVRCLVELGANVNAVNSRYQDTPLHTAAKAGNVEIIRYLATHGSDLSATDWIEWTPLHCAVWANKTEAVRCLVEEFQANVEPKTRTLETPLRLAFKANNPTVIKCLLAAGANLEAIDCEGQTVLHWAARNGKVNIIHYLVVKLNADIESKDKYGRTPLVVANDFRKFEVVFYLMQLGANLQNLNKDDLVLRASKCGHTGAIKRLLTEGANLNQVSDTQDRTPLHWAIREGEHEMVKTLLEHGASISKLDKYHKTPIEWAKLYDEKDAVEILTMWANEVKRPSPKA